MVTQEQSPLTGVWNGRRMLQDVHDGEAILHANSHEKTWHQRKMVCHVALISIAKVSYRVLRPLVSLGKQHSILELLAKLMAQFFQEGVRLLEVLAVRPFSLKEIRHGIEAQAGYAHTQPEIDRLYHCLLNLRVIVIQVGLMRVKPVPVIGFGKRVKGPVR